MMTTLNTSLSLIWTVLQFENETKQGIDALSTVISTFYTHNRSCKQLLRFENETK